jgi:cysteinyl-tRNA synthetase
LLDNGTVTVVTQVRQSLQIDFYTPGAVLALLDLASAAQKYVGSVHTPSTHLLQTVSDVINNTMASFGMTSFGASAPADMGVAVGDVQAAFVKFRDDVRQVAVAAIKAKAPDCAQKVLGLCDDARNNVFPKVGIVAGDPATKTNTVG